MYTVGYSAVFLFSTYQMSVAYTSLSHDDKKCVQALPKAPKGAKSPPVEKLLYANRSQYDLLFSFSALSMHTSFLSIL